MFIAYTDQLEQVVQVLIEQCSSFTGCLSCAANVNPLCGWCTVEQKCSWSSGLPSPLTGESFLCLLSTGDGVPISVPCSQVNQTTGAISAISQLNTPEASFVCCSSCLQTDGVCGWCNVEKRCTAVNSSCSNVISVTPAGGQTYLDVHPSLLNARFLPLSTDHGIEYEEPSFTERSAGLRVTGPWTLD
eukprot:Em0459g5a